MLGPASRRAGRSQDDLAGPACRPARGRCDSALVGPRHAASRWTRPFRAPGDVATSLTSIALPASPAVFPASRPPPLPACSLSGCSGHLRRTPRARAPHLHELPIRIGVEAHPLLTVVQDGAAVEKLRTNAYPGSHPNRRLRATPTSPGVDREGRVSRAQPPCPTTPTCDPRSAKNITLTTVAEHLHVWPARIGELERGRRRDGQLADRYREWLTAA